ncbi:MAG: alanine--glyoxylate aminotransferase family protein [Bacteroidia bacterium]|nr:alanine--glyoxylate aminotransferase family protein [Bacteroidia bacterium]
MPREYLLTPGPVDIPGFVLQAVAQPAMHHRTQEFARFYLGLLDGLRYYFQTRQHVATMTGSGTYGVESAIYSLFRPGEKILVLNNGKFSGRWADYGRLIGLQVEELRRSWGESPGVEEVIDVAELHPDLHGVVITHSETSTGAMVDLEELVFALRRQVPDALLVVDAITSAGAMPFYFDDWQLDCAIAASQKALMNPAGVVCMALSERAARHLRVTDPSDFTNFLNYLRLAEQGAYPYTPAVNLLFGVQAALEHLQQLGLPQAWNRTHHAAKTFRKGLAALGGKVFPQRPSESLTAFTLPVEQPDELRRKVLESSGFRLAGGQDSLKNRILRISHMGLADAAVMEEALAALRSAMQA